MAATTHQPPTKETRVVSRFLMYFFFFGTCTTHFLTREMAPMLIPMICSEFGYTSQQTGLLLGSYFPGYIVGQIPAAMLAGKIGCRNVLTLSNMATILIAAATPLAAKGVRSLEPQPATHCQPTILGPPPHHMHTTAACCVLGIDKAPRLRSLALLTTLLGLAGGSMFPVSAKSPAPT